MHVCKACGHVQAVAEGTELLHMDVPEPVLEKWEAEDPATTAAEVLQLDELRPSAEEEAEALREHLCGPAFVEGQQQQQQQQWRSLRQWPTLTPYEQARLLGVRAAHLEGGAQPLVEPSEGATSSEVAEAELRCGALDALYEVERCLPDGSTEALRVGQLRPPP